MAYPIFDMHCDLLSYLQRDRCRTIYDAASRCAVSQLQRGGVRFQTLAIFADTEPNSSKLGLAQLEIYKQLPILYPTVFAHASSFASSNKKENNLISIGMAFENASAFCEEQEPLKEGLQRLEWISQTIAKPIYISLTWNMANRFGGGAHTTIGLKDDGKRLLDFLHAKRIAIDLSHASDHLAEDILGFIDQKNLDIAVMASHSNTRHVYDVPRNLSDELIQEIIHRQGVIGLNFYRFFMGPTFEDSLIKHLDHFVRLGGYSHIGFGADFFYEPDFPNPYRPKGEVFFANYQDASCYVRVMDLLEQRWSSDVALLKGIAFENVQAFLSRLADVPVETF